MMSPLVTDRGVVIVTRVESDRDHVFHLMKLLKRKLTEVKSGRLKGFVRRYLGPHTDRNAQAFVVVDASNAEGMEGELARVFLGHATHLLERLTHERHKRISREWVPRVGTPRLFVATELRPARRKKERVGASLAGLGADDDSVAPRDVSSE